MKVVRLLVVAGLMMAACFAQAPADTNQATMPKAIPAFDPGAMDPTANACVNFYQFACGNWMKNNPIPADRSRWGRFDELQQNNQAILRQIVEQNAANNPKRDAVEQKIGDYYAACMDETAINGKGTAPIQPELNRIAQLKSKDELPELLSHLHGIGVNAFFRMESQQDFADASKMIADTDQGGLGLPDRDYYLKTDAKSEELRKAYVAHLERTFALLGEPAAKAAADAKVVMAMETALAKASLDRVSRRDPQKLYHMMSVQELGAASPQFAWPRYFTGVRLPGLTTLNVVWPDFFKEFSAALQQNSLDDIKTYLRWQLVHAASALLPTPFVNEDFDFYGKTLTGAKELRPRWKRCVSFTDGDLGEALGQPYVDKTFGVEGKQRTLKMVQALEDALNRDISGLPWMTPETKKQALVKLEAIRNKIGYPDKWRDYSKLEVRRGDAMGNSFRANEFEFNRQLGKIGKPVDKNEWDMTPPTVNAYYSPQMNDINFPAGILQPPFYSNQADDAVNFGGIGAVIGHELTHGFDDEGRQFDAKGNLRDWWTPADAKAFDERAACIVNEYSGFTVANGEVHLNGKLTLGENTADNGGLRIALMALHAQLAKEQNPPAKINGFTQDQRLFIAWGQIWCQNATEQEQRRLAAIDPHSPGEYRVNGVVRNMPEFGQAFGCKAGDPMVQGPVCRVW